jgi:hypothetical protein
MAAWQESEMTQAAYCEHNDLNLKTFAYWRHRLKNGSRAVKLVQIAAPQANPMHNTFGSLKLIVDGRFAIEVSDGFDPSTLARIVEVVQGR